MLIYLDMCCLKRPFDDQRQPRIRLDTEAVLQLLALESDKIRFVRSAALLENSFNPVPERAKRVETWLRSTTIWNSPDPTALQTRVDALRLLGLQPFDALHVASAEQAAADRFVSVDDRLLKAADRRADPVVARAVSALECLLQVHA